jgi:hypothetical protein
VVKGSIPSHHHIHQKEVHMQLYIEGMCADEVDEWIFINGQKLLASGQERCVRLAVGAPSGRCPE